MKFEVPINQKPIIYNKDIIKDVVLVMQKPQETYIQQSCKVIFDGIKLEMRDRFEMDFMQVDNGGKQTQGGKFRKKAEGTIKGASDVQLWFHCKKTGLSKMVLCEFLKLYKVYVKRNLGPKLIFDYNLKLHCVCLSLI